MSVNINHQLEQVNNLKITPVGSGATVGSAGIVTYYGDGSNLTGIDLGVGIRTEGSVAGYGITFLDFRGAGVSTITAPVSGISTINITGGGSGSISISTTPPSSPSAGDLWYDPDYGRTLIYYDENEVGYGTSKQWIDSSPLTNTGIITSTSINTANLTVTGVTTSTSFVKSGGTSSQFLKADGSVDSSTYITSADGGNAATLDSLDSTQFLRSDAADTKTSGDLTFNDSIKANFGTGSDLQIYHNGSYSYIKDTGTGGLVINTDALYLKNAADNEAIAYFVQDSSVSLYFDNSKKFETTTSGVTVTGDVNSTSDINLKKDIEVVTSATEILNQLRGIKFAWKENDEKSVGVIAQEVETVLPELVRGEEGNKSVNYSGLIGVLIEAVKEQQKQIDTLTKRIEELGG